MAEATSKRAASMSFPFWKRTVMLPEPFRETDDTCVIPPKDESVPSRREVTSASTTSCEASGYEKETMMSLPPDVGIYWIFRRGIHAIPNTDKASITKMADSRPRL